MTKSDGGPAYPFVCDVHKEIEPEAHPGMSLRDEFAIAALPAVITGMNKLYPNDLLDLLGKLSASNAHEGIAISSYKIADAMLAEREK